ncbi:hypothetical protein Tco_0505258 [Tanacetum coccineum]
MWKPEVCSTCKVFGHGNEKCKKGQKDPTHNVTESGNIGRSKESVNEGNYKRNYEVRRDNHVGFNQMKGGWRNVGYMNGTYRRKENNKDVREYQQKKVMENNKEEQGRTLQDDIVDAINKSPNKFDVLVEDNERQDGKERRILWKNLIASNRIVNNKPWCLLDDFNVTLKLEEHTAGGSNISEDMQELFDCINETEVEDINSSAKCLSQYMEAIDDAENLLMQQAKVDWISKGDRNNKFFHNILKSGGNMHKITNICNEKGNSFEGNEVAEQFV